jgi:hypothetical protein
MTTTLTESLVDALASQYEAALSMLRSCVERVDAETGDVPVGSYPFWRVAYHVLNATICTCHRTRRRSDRHPFTATDTSSWASRSGPRRK